MKPRACLLLLLAFYLACPSSYPGAQSGAVNDVSVEGVAFRDGEVRGTLTNNASHRVRDVELLVRYFWVWKARHRSSEQAPELTFEYTVRREIAPRGSIPFSYTTPPLPVRNDGYYDIEVRVVGSVDVDALHAQSPPRGAGKSADLKTDREVARIVAIEDLDVRGAVVSGKLRNRAPHRIRDVELLIRHVWVPNNEYQPGGADAGKSAYHTVRGEIPPGGSIPFTYDASPLPSRPDGQFQTKVAVAGFQEVGVGGQERDREPPRIRLGNLIPTTEQGRAAAKLDATVEDPSGIDALEVWLNGAKATARDLSIEPGNRKRIQFTRTIALPRYGDNCVAVEARDARGNSSMSREVCLYRGPEAAPRTAHEVASGRAAGGRRPAAPRVAEGPRIDLLRPHDAENIVVGTVRLEANLEDESGIASVDVWLNEKKLPPAGAGPGGRKRMTIERDILVSRMGINCFALNARSVGGQTSRKQVCLVTRQQGTPGQTAREVRPVAPAPGPPAASPAGARSRVPPARRPTPPPVPDPAPDVIQSGRSAALTSPAGAGGGEGPQISLERKIDILKQHYLAERITAGQFDRAVRALESGQRNRMLEDFLAGKLSVSTFRRAF